MKKIFLLAFGFLVIVLILEIGINYYLSINKNLIASKLFKQNYRLTGVYYVFPNIIYIQRMYVTSDQYKISVNDVLLSFNLVELLNKNFVIKSLKTKNVFLEINNINQFVSGETVDLQDKIKSFFMSLPSKVKSKEISIKYGNETIKINSISKQNYKKSKIGINIDGEWRKFKFDTRLITDVSKFEWISKSKIYLSLHDTNLVKTQFSFPTAIEIEMSGIYDLTKFQKFFVSLIQDKKKEKIMSGMFKLFPFEIVGETENKVVQGKFSGKTEEGKFVINYDGVFKIFNFLNGYFAKLDNIRTGVSLNITQSGYEATLKISNRFFTAVVDMYNHNGSFKIKTGDESFIGVIKYDEIKKIVYIHDENKNKLFNIKMSFYEKNSFTLEGNISGFVVLCSLLYSKEQLKLDISCNKEQKQVKLGLVSDYKIANSNIYYKSGDTILDSKVYIELTQNVKFDITAENFKLGRNVLSFVMSGMIKKESIKEGKYVLVASATNCYIDRISIFDNANISGEISKDRVSFNLSSVDKTVIATGEWIPGKNFFTVDISLKKEKLYIAGIKTDIYSKVKLINDKMLNITGTYKLRNLEYNKKTIAESVEGKFNMQDNNFIFVGNLTSKKKVYKYEVLLPVEQKKFAMLKLTNLVLFPWNKPDTGFNAELYFNPDFLSKEELAFFGRLYNDTGEIVISSATFLLYKNILKIEAKIKNINIKDTYVIANLKSEIRLGKEQNLYLNIVFSDLWLNNYPINKMSIQCEYDIRKNKLEFYPVGIQDKNNITIAGEVFISPQNISFVNCKILYGHVDEMLTFNGAIGKKSDILKVNFVRIPLEMVISIFNLSIFDTSGEITGTCEILTVEPFKNDYRLATNFIVRNVKIAGIKMGNMSGKLNFSRNNVDIENIDFIFDTTQKISFAGNYNVKNQNINFSITSSKCNLSLFNNFYNLVKTAEGSIAIDVKVRGKTSSPKFYGYINIHKGNLRFSQYLKRLDNTNLELKFEGDKIKIEKCVAHYEQTKVIVNGYYDITGIAELRIRTEGGNGLFVSLPELSFPVGRFFKIVKGETTFPSNGNLHFDLELKKDKVGTLLTGNVVMNNTYFTYPGIKGKQAMGRYENFFYDITLLANNNVWYENEALSANITGKMNFKYLKGMQKSSINGQVETVRGKVFFLNTPFNINSGRLEVVNKDVYIELEAETDIVTAEGDKIAVKLILPKSKIEEIKPKLVSPTYPELKTEDITALMLGVGKIQKFEDKISVVALENIDYLPLLRTQFIKMIDTAFTTPIAKNILQKWGIADNLVISQVPSGSVSSSVVEKTETGLSDRRINIVDILKNTKYGVEKYISPDMIIGYSITLAEVQNKLNLKHELEISYRLKNNIFIKGIYNYGYKDYANKYTGDVRIQIEPRFKFKSWAEEEKENK